jgi:hypothetical protein
MLLSRTAACIPLHRKGQVGKGFLAAPEHVQQIGIGGQEQLSTT